MPLRKLKELGRLCTAYSGKPVELQNGDQEEGSAVEDSRELGGEMKLGNLLA